MTDDLPGLVAQLDEALAEPERTCEWCMARPGEWCISDCGSPGRRCHPSYVAQYAAENGASTDADAALIVAAVDAPPALLAAARELLDLRQRIGDLADELSRWSEINRQLMDASEMPPEGHTYHDGLREAQRLAAARLRALVPASPPGRAPCICNRVAEGAAFHSRECEASWAVAAAVPTTEDTDG